MFKDVATTIAEKCVNPTNKHPYPVSMIEKAMRECHIAVKPNKSSKQQALEAIPKLREHLPIQRAQMRVRLVSPVAFSKSLKAILKKLSIAPEKEEVDDDSIQVTCLINPGQFRMLDEQLRDQTSGRGQLELLDLKETVDVEGNL